MEKGKTRLGNSYWDNTGYYQDIYDRLYDNLVPSNGDADTIHGELIRCIGRLYYDFCNNGNRRKFYRTGSIFGGIFRLGKTKRFVIRASLLRETCNTNAKTRKSFVVPRKRLARITKSLSLPSRKVPARLEPFP